MAEPYHLNPENSLHKTLDRLQFFSFFNFKIVNKFCKKKVFLKGWRTDGRCFKNVKNNEKLIRLQI